MRSNLGAARSSRRSPALTAPLARWLRPTAVHRRSNLGPSLRKLIAKAYAEYEKLKSANQALDFDDLLYHCVLMLREAPAVAAQVSSTFKHVLVDEFQVRAWEGGGEMGLLDRARPPTRRTRADSSSR